MRVNTINMNKTHTLNLVVLTAFTVLTLALTGCGSAPKCKDYTSEGNMGGYFNSPADEFSPIVNKNIVSFATTQSPTNPSLTILKSEYRKNEFKTPSVEVEMLRLGFKNLSVGSVFTDSKTGNQEIYFSAESQKGRADNRDIYQIKVVKGKWGKPLPIANLNTNARELYPAVSPDGAWLVFSSDREGGIGELDLYSSRRQPDGSWASPENLSSLVNSDKNEITPFISESNSLYFATRALSINGSYDIVKCERRESSWGAPVQLAMPINTEYDETGPAILQNKIIFASNRPGGCGGYDLFMFDNCGPAVLEVRAVTQAMGFPLNGTSRLLDENKKLIEEQEVDESGICRFPIELNRSYTVQYSNACLEDADGEITFVPPCNESTSVKLVASFVLPLPAGEMRFDELKIPFFVSGYYRVNTKANLESLRRLFTYNLLGTSDSTRYIENPGKNYDDYVTEVESALENAANFLSNRLELISSECMNGDEKIRIIITGFADQRPFSKKAVFSENSIHDPDFNMEVTRGENMTNDLLSRLRAYFAAKHIEQYLSRKDSYNNLKDRIIWEVEGRGVDDTANSSYEFKRRVNLKIQLENQ